MSQEIKWQDGQEVKPGMFIQPKLFLNPEVIPHKAIIDGKEVVTEHTQLHKYSKGAGRFKSGLPIGHLPDGTPVTMLVDIRIGKKPKVSQSPSVSKVQL